jgi:Arc/MetJ-type ribon-helix-helix transcriptional regulator
MTRNEPDAKLSVSLPAELAERLRTEAERRLGGDMSAAVAEALQDWLSKEWESPEEFRARALAAMEGWDAEHPITEEEEAAARAWVADLKGWDIDDPRLYRNREDRAS